MRRAFLLFAASVASMPAGADELSDAQAKVAQIVTLSELASQACPNLKLDPEVVAGFLRHAGLTPDAVAGRFSAETRSVADAFTRSVRQDPAAACAAVEDHLGSRGLGLLQPET